MCVCVCIETGKNTERLRNMELGRNWEGKVSGWGRWRQRKRETHILITVIIYEPGISRLGRTKMDVKLVSYSVEQRCQYSEDTGETPHRQGTFSGPRRAPQIESLGVPGEGPALGWTLAAAMPGVRTKSYVANF